MIDPTVFNPLIGQLVLLLTTIAGFVAAAWRENRNRRWAAEDRAIQAAIVTAERRAATEEIIERARAEAEAVRIKTDAAAAALREEGIQLAARIRAQQAATAQHLIAKVGEATTAAHEAYKEANDVNGKIADLNERLLIREARTRATDPKA